MEQDNSTKISLTDLFAFFVREFWVFIIGALIGMALLLSYHIVVSNSANGVEAYEIDSLKYKEELSSLERIRDNLKLKIELANEVESSSPIFSDNQVFVSKIIITVDSDVVMQSANSESENNIVGHEISSFWNNLDLVSVTGLNIDNDVLKSSIIFELAGQSAAIRVYSEDKSEVEKSAERIVGAFVSYFDNREHLSIGSKAITTSVATKSEIVSVRELFVSEKNELLKKSFDTESAINTMKKEAPSRYHFLKYAVIGLLVGVAVVLLVLCVLFVSHNPITNSFFMENELEIPFLGAFFLDTSLFSKLARKIMGERFFRSNEDSAEYLKSSLSSISGTTIDSKKSITLISSLKDSKIDSIAEEIGVLLTKEGFETTFVNNSLENPLAITTIANNGNVILLEKQWNSRIQFARINKDLASKLDKRVLGFIIC